VDVKNALRLQGLSSINDFISLSEDNIEDVCKIVPRPGGTIPNPAFGQGAGRGAQPPVLPNPDLQVGHLHEKDAEILCIPLTEDTARFRSSCRNDGHSTRCVSIEGSR
jgi:hypothetical protein